MSWNLRQWRGRVPWVAEGKRAHADASASPTGGHPRTVFILPGGGSRGAAQAGALGVLVRHGIIPDLIIGVSAGSWNGAFLARYPTVEATRELERLWLETTSRELLGGSRLRPAFNVLRRQKAIFGAAGMAQVAERYIGEYTFEDCVVPLRILAADLTTGAPYFFTDGRLVQAVLASSAMPGVFPPVTIGDQTYIDGGIVDWAASRMAIEAGAQRVCLVTCGSRRLRATSARESFRHIFERAMEMGSRDSFERTAFALRATGIEVLAIHPELDEENMLDFDHAPKMIAAGRRAAELALAEWDAARSLSTRVPSATAAPVERHARTALPRTIRSTLRREPPATQR